MQGGGRAASLGSSPFWVVPAPTPSSGHSVTIFFFLACQCLCFCSACDLLIVKLLYLLMCSEQGLEPLGNKGLQGLVSQINTQGRETVGGVQQSVYFELCLIQKPGSQRKDVHFNASVALPISNNGSCC